MPASIGSSAWRPAATTTTSGNCCVTWRIRPVASVDSVPRSSHQHAAAAGHEELDGLIRRMRSPDGMMVGDRIAGRLEDLLVGGQQDDVDRRVRLATRGAGHGFDLTSLAFHVRSRPERAPTRPAGLTSGAVGSPRDQQCSALRAMYPGTFQPISGKPEAIRNQPRPGAAVATRHSSARNRTRHKGAPRG